MSKKLTSYQERVKAHAQVRKLDLTKDPCNGHYSEVADDRQWLESDQADDWGSDDGHNDMLSFCPSDAALIEWRCGPGRARWLKRAEDYNAAGTNPCPEYAQWILRRVKELDVRFASFGAPP